MAAKLTPKRSWPKVDIIYKNKQNGGAPLLLLNGIAIWGKKRGYGERRRGGEGEGEKDGKTGGGPGIARSGDQEK